ncbi:MAG: VOC family protein [Actinomycetota bacterium]
MKLNHLDLSVSDVAQARDFFVEHFDFTCLEDKSEKMSILRGADGFVLVLDKLKSNDSPNYPAQFHIGFILNNENEVENKRAQLQRAGIEVPHQLRKNTRGTMFYFTAPGGILIEVSCR